MKGTEDQKKFFARQKQVNCKPETDKNYLQTRYLTCIKMTVTLSHKVANNYYILSHQTHTVFLLHFIYARKSG